MAFAIRDNMQPALKATIFVSLLVRANRFDPGFEAEYPLPGDLGTHVSFFLQQRN